MRDITLPPSPERWLKSLRRMVVLRGVASVALAAVLVWVITSGDAPLGVMVAMSLLLLFEVLWFAWGVYELRRAQRWSAIAARGDHKP